MTYRVGLFGVWAALKAWVEHVRAERETNRLMAGMAALSKTVGDDGDADDVARDVC